MARDWDVTFGFWGSAPSNTEQEKCGNAERAIRKAIAACPKLSNTPIDVFVQGSYANCTNVRQDSDVDICVLYKGDAFFPDYQLAPELNSAALGFGTGDYSYAEFKNDVEAALVSYFGRPAVRRGKKAFDIRENTYRVDADVVPCFEHRLYVGNRFSHYYHSGTRLFPDNGGHIDNYPKQNHDNGVAKGGKFKAVTRILKNLRFELVDEGHAIAEKIPSYLIECLVYLAPDAAFANVMYRHNVRYVLAYLWNETRIAGTCDKWTEVNGIKYLFHATQPWRREDVNAFLQAAWDYVRYE